MLLTDVRDLTEKYMEDIMNLKLQGKEILPLLCEMFNLWLDSHHRTEVNLAPTSSLFDISTEVLKALDTIDKYSK